MSDYMTVWPDGSNQPGYEPISAMQAMAGHRPMFSGEGPRYAGSFNAGTRYDGVISMMLPQIMQLLTQQKYMPTQFLPMQQLSDQMEATRYYEASQQAMSFAAQRDVGTINQTIGGFRQLLSGRPLNEIEQAQNFRMASGFSKFLPMLTNILGPDMIDQLHGSRGSATVFAQQLHQALRTGYDPITHAAGYSGESAGKIAQHVFEQTFGPGADITAMKGISAGQAGMLSNELQMRGLLGQPLGLLSPDAQRSLLPKQLSTDTINRLAEQLPAIQEILRNDGTPNEDVLAKARADIQETHAKLVDPTVKMTAEDMGDADKLPGAQDIIRAGDAARIGQRLKNMSGAVKAMRDIFGDMGNPNAPMREIISGLEALTQGGIATMSPGELEMTVRRSQAIAKQTGIGMEGLVALTTGGVDLTDKLGLDRSFARTAAEHAALYGAAAGDRLRLDIPVWGARSKDELTLAAHQLNVRNAASPAANQLNAILRMADTGVMNPKEGSELAALVSAVKDGKQTYTFDGKSRSVRMEHDNLENVLWRDSGVTATELQAHLFDMKGNQEYGQKYSTDRIVARFMPEDYIRKTIQPMVGHKLNGMFKDRSIDKTLKAAGVDVSDDELRKMSHRLAKGVGDDFFFNMDEETLRDPTAKRAYLNKSFQDQFRKELRVKMPKATDADIEAIVGQMGNIGGTIQATINEGASYNPLFKSDIGLRNSLSDEVLDQVDSRRRQTEITALTSKALSGLGIGDPLRRMSDVLQNADSETPWEEVLAKALGGVSIDAVKAADPTGGMAQLLGLVRANKNMDPNDPKQVEQARWNAAMAEGLVNGGETAKEQLRLLDEDIKAGKVPADTPLRRSLEAATQRDSKIGILGDYGYQMSAAVGIDQVQATVESGTRAEALLHDSAATAAERADAMSKYVLGSRARGRQLLQDDRSMHIIGQGGMDIVRSAMEGSDKLQVLAAEQTKKLGHDVTITDILRGEGGVEDAVTTEANEIYAKMNSDWAEIAKRRGFGVLPGKGDDPLNKTRTAMTKQEEDDLKALNEFELQNGTAEERAAAVLDELAEIATPEQRHRMLADTNKKLLTDAIVSGDRGVSMFRAVRGRNELLEMGIKKGVFGNKTKISDLTDEEEHNVGSLLAAKELTDAERADVARLQSDSAILTNFGDATTEAGDVTTDALRRIQQSAVSQPIPPTDNSNKEVKLKMDGSVTIKDDGKADISLSGTSLWSAIMNAIGPA